MPARHRPPVKDDRLLTMLSRVAAAVLIGMVVILPLSEAFDLPFAKAGFKLDPAELGLLIAALLVLLGALTIRQLPGITFGPKPGDEEDKDDDPA